MTGQKIAFLHAMDDIPQIWIDWLLGAFQTNDAFEWGKTDHAADAVDYVLTFRPPEGALHQFINAKALFSLGAGVDSFVKDPDLPQGPPIIRSDNPDMTNRMSEYVIWQVLDHHRRGPDYRHFAALKQWKPLLQPAAKDRRVGIMGLGNLGQDAAKKLSALGFPVAGWSRSSKEIEGVESFSGTDGPNDLDAFLARTDILVSLLPLTDQTRGLMNKDLFAKLPKGASVINVGRGEQLVTADLLAALHEGHIAGATLDVLDEEPLNPNAPLWAHPRVTVTPHIASTVDPAVLAGRIEDQIAQMEQGKAAHEVGSIVDFERGY